VNDYGVICAVLGALGGALWLALLHAAEHKTKRYKALWGVVAQSSQPRLFALLTVVRWVSIGAMVAAAAFLSWLHWG
jgi:hypothetical protein